MPSNEDVINEEATEHIAVSRAGLSVYTGTKDEQAVIATPFTSTNPLVIYVATTGIDANSGLSPSAPVLTLTRAHAIAEANGVGRDIEVQIAPGRYHHQQVTWTFTQPNYKVRIIPTPGAATKPIFDGCRAWTVTTDYATQCDLNGYFFRLLAPTGQATNVYLENIHIQRYNQGVAFVGNKSDPTKGNSHNHIYGCVFYNIGNAFNPNLYRGEAGVSLANSDNNTIEKTRFYRLRNADPAEDKFLHAIYMNSYSTNNMVKDCYLHLCFGSPFRVRNASHYNKFHSNHTYATANESGLGSDWYDASNGECPSYGTDVRYNYKDGDYTCAAQPRNVDPTPPSGTQSGCANPSGVARFSTSLNTTSAKPCDGSSPP